jgi:hypothetical protein
MKNAFILLFLLFIGCANKDKVIIPVEEITHKKITNQNVFVGTGGPMILINSYIVGMEYTLDTCFYYLGLENDIFDRFGNRGQGSDEYLYPKSIEYINDTILGVYDMMKREYIKVSIPTALENRSKKK